MPKVMPVLDRQIRGQSCDHGPHQRGVRSCAGPSWQVWRSGI